MYNPHALFFFPSFFILFFFYKYIIRLHRPSLSIRFYLSSTLNHSPSRSCIHKCRCVYIIYTNGYTNGAAYKERSLLKCTILPPNTSNHTGNFAGHSRRSTKHISRTYKRISIKFIRTPHKLPRAAVILVDLTIHRVCIYTNIHVHIYIFLPIFFSHSNTRKININIDFIYIKLFYNDSILSNAWNKKSS